MGMQAVTKIKEIFKKKNGKALSSYALHKALVEMGIDISSPNTIDNYETDGTRSIMMDVFFGLKDYWCGLGKSESEFYLLFEKEFGNQSKFRRNRG